MSLKSSWQQQRCQRQQEMLNRHQAVYASLNTIRQERHSMATQLRYELGEFHDLLNSENAARRAELQQFCQRLQAETSALLSAASDRRHAQAIQFAQELDMFIQLLRQETSDFLTTAHNEQAATAHQMKQELMAFMDNLRSDMHQYLTELETIRQNRAMQLSQELSQSRANREAETQALFQRLAAFRAELHHFAQNLHAAVWGESGSTCEDRQSIMPHSVVALSTPMGSFQMMTQ